MELFKLCFTLVSLTLLMFPTKSHADDFKTAYEKITEVKTTIKYHKFCSEMKSGQEKLACRIKKVPTIGFLVCKVSEYCNQQITTEVNNLLYLARNHINTVKLSSRSSYRIITGVKCAEEDSTACSGFLVEWIGRSSGKFEHLRDRIVYDQIPNVIANVQHISSGRSALKRSCSDLNDIINFMRLPEGKKYRQICDLQGFFMVNGGFKVTDVPQIQEKMRPKQRCWEGEPTTEEVYTAVMTLRDEFKKG